jgi:hypothetical protein
MLVISIRFVLALILITTVPYALTVAAVVVLWFDENRYAISRKNYVTRRFRAVRFAVTSTVPRNAIGTPGHAGSIRGPLQTKRLKIFEKVVSKSASERLRRASLVGTDREELSSLIGVRK